MKYETIYGGMALGQTGSDGATITRKTIMWIKIELTVGKERYEWKLKGTSDAEIELPDNIVHRTHIGEIAENLLSEALQNMRDVIAKAEAEPETE